MLKPHMEPKKRKEGFVTNRCFTPRLYYYCLLHYSYEQLLCMIWALIVYSSMLN